MLPMIRNFLSCSTICEMYSRKSEKGGFVTTISASLSNSPHSSLRKSPLPCNFRDDFLLRLSRASTSSKPIAPSLLLSGTSFISTTYGSLPSGLSPSISNNGICLPTIGDLTKLVVMSFFNPSALKLAAKYLKKLLSNGSSQLQYTTLLRNWPL